ncbi:uncharacterized protein K460DRAFT_85541 [Cucurbitaria berberidis CBS 394.84]|uniref:Uncharacterized protein n=1 Tax=Cucurbitaria berberidis CBS 394.84 TaxID=1168544 RepID=A0A9P4GMH8_9PLEO|nr:uncharacterized protein K460DRAFT_85541 [Cucurbitaria berberidis CBS 394.84]KAF1849133.1 hypothetical protein K460DRAFT_85541 [Cucurbitaria berberidis CBS 394.84]
MPSNLRFWLVSMPLDTPRGLPCKRSVLSVPRQALEATGYRRAGYRASAENGVLGLSYRLSIPSIREDELLLHDCGDYCEWYQSIPQDNKWIVYSHLASSLGYRSTTNINDEFLCVASVIGFSVATYTNLSVEKARQRTAELCMKAFLGEIARFRQRIIFNNY